MAVPVPHARVAPRPPLDTLSLRRRRFDAMHALIARALLPQLRRTAGTAPRSLATGRRPPLRRMACAGSTREAPR